MFVFSEIRLKPFIKIKPDLQLKLEAIYQTPEMLISFYRKALKQIELYVEKIFILKNWTFGFKNL